MNRKTLLLSVTLIAIVLLGVVGIGWVLYFRPVTVQIGSAQQDVPVQVFGLGTVEARVTSQVGFKISGLLVDLRTDVGNRVPKGMVLARLNDCEQRAQVTRAKAAVEQAEADLQRATASVKKAQANYSNAKHINKRQQNLVQSKIASIETAQTAQVGEDVALADLNLANSDVLVAKAAISGARAQQQLQVATLGFYTLSAPYDAMVTARLKELGSAVNSGQPVLKLIDPQTIWVLAYIDESKAGKIRVGQPARIALRSRPNERLQGRVFRIEPESDRVTEERRVEVAFNHLPEIPHLGEQAEIYITTVHLKQAVFVPEAAIIRLRKKRGTVWTVEDGRLQQRETKLGHRLLDGRYEITGGVPENAAVVTQLRSGLRIGRAAKTTDGLSR